MKTELSSGGVYTCISAQLPNLNQYATALRLAADEKGSEIEFELQSTFATKVNCFITDSLEINPDNIIIAI